MGNLFGFLKNSNLKCTKKSHTHITFIIIIICFKIIMHKLNLECYKKITINMKLCINPSFLLFVSKDPLHSFIIFYVFIRGLRTNRYIILPQSNLPLAKGEQIKNFAYLV
jgi:hypothetical protein